MTPEEINRALAERVMGWRAAKHGSWETGGEIRARCEWDPYHSIAHAFEVVETMRAKGYCFELDYNQSECKARMWPDGKFWETAACKFYVEDTPAAAISIAALRAVGVEPGEVGA